MRRWITTLATASALTLGIAGLATPAQAGTCFGTKAPRENTPETTRPLSPAERVVQARAKRVAQARKAAADKDAQLTLRFKKADRNWAEFLYFEEGENIALNNDELQTAIKLTGGDCLNHTMAVKRAEGNLAATIDGCESAFLGGITKCVLAFGSSVNVIETEFFLLRQIHESRLNKASEDYIDAINCILLGKDQI